MLLEEGDQFSYIAKKSIFLTWRMHVRKRYRLYSCENFHVEIRYNETDPGIEDIRLFRGAVDLAPYLHSITVDFG